MKAASSTTAKWTVRPRRVEPNLPEGRQTIRLPFLRKICVCVVRLTLRLTMDVSMNVWTLVKVSMDWRRVADMMMLVVWGWVRA